MLNNRETDRKKSAQYKVKSQHYKWLFKNLTNFSVYIAISVPPLSILLQIFTQHFNFRQLTIFMRSTRHLE